MLQLLDTPRPVPRHPAQYPDVVVEAFWWLLRGRIGAPDPRVLDPFGGVGGIFKLHRWLPGARIEAVEIEPEWAAADRRITCGNALYLPWGAGTFDAVCTSPTYGNRMADHHEARDATRRNTYRHALGRPLHPDNSGAMQWGRRYRDFHKQAWAEAARVLRPGGWFALNCKDHFRAGDRKHVTEWHVGVLAGLGFVVVERMEVVCPGNRYGANGGVRLGYEDVTLLRLQG